MNLSAFKTYDVRGLYPDEVDEELAFKIGKSSVKYLNAKTIAVGRDMRLSSPSLHKYLLAGITSENCKVLDIGMCTTPMLNFAVASKNLDGGIMISASHNPKEYNAFKIINGDAIQLYGEGGLNKIKLLVKKLKEFDKNIEPNESKVEVVDVLNNYINHIFSISKVKGRLNVVVDCGNGVGGISAKAYFDKLQGSGMVEFLYLEPDGTFPNHNADPHHLENLTDLQIDVKNTKSDFGAFFDGDADRCYIVDEKGKVVLADILFCILVDYELNNYNYSNKTIYNDLRFSKVINDVANKNGTNAVTVRVGNPFYKEALKTRGGSMAGEFSGHIMYSKNYNIDDGLLVMVKVMEVLEHSGKDLSQLVKRYTQYASSKEISIKVPSMQIAKKIMKKIKNKYNDGESKDIDGVYIAYPSWWFNLRKSNTEPVVRLRLEADNQQTLDEKKKDLLKVINSYV